MKRWALNLLAGASLALAVLTAGLWVRSHWRGDRVGFGGNTPLAEVVASEGRVLLKWDKTRPLRVPLAWYHRSHQAIHLPKEYGAPRWEIGPVEVWNRKSDRLITVRHWSLLLLFSLAPCAWLLRGPLLRRRRMKLGLCRHCGYDLRATPGRCPECGRENAPSPLAADSTLRRPGARSLPVGARGENPPGDAP